MKKWYHYLIAFIVPVLIFFVIMSLRDFYPLKDYALRSYDSALQYPPFFIGLKNFSLFSLNVGLGFNYFATACYYLLSPFNLLIFLFNNTNFDIFYTLIILLKIGFISLSMFILLSKEHKVNIFTFLFSFAYSLCGFVSAYYYNVMWLDGIILLPLIVLGINNIIKNNKYILYLITLTLGIITNFYIGYMLCIFSLLYFIFKYINSKKNPKAIKIFILASLACGLLSAFVLIPSIYALLGGKAQGYTSGFTNYFAFNNNSLSFFYMLTPASFASGDQAYGPAMVYSSLLALSSFIILFINPEYTKKFKITLFIFILIYMASFAFNLFDFAWQMFQKPVWWQSRYSFTLSFLLIYLGYDSFMKKEKIKWDNKTLISLIIAVILLFIISFVGKFESITNDKNIYIVFLLYSSLLFITYLCIFNYKKYYKFMAVLLIFELSINTFNALKQNATNTNVVDNNSYSETFNKSLEALDDLDTYRLEASEFHFYNDGLYYNYNGVNYFNSVRNQKIVNFSENVVNLKVGSHCSIILNRFDPMILSLFNIKYLVGNHELVSYYDEVVNNDYLSVFANKDIISYGFMVNNKVLESDFYNNDYFSNITTIYNGMLGTDYKYFYELSDFVSFSMDELEQDDGTEYLFSKSNNDLIIEFIADKDYMIVPNDNDSYKSYLNFNINGKNISIGKTYITVYKGDTLTVSYKNLPVLESKVKIKLLDLNIFAKATNELKSHSLETYSCNNVLCGNIKAEENNILYLSIPYDKGFSIYVDNKKEDIVKIYDTFIGVKLSNGTHDIKIKYFPYGLKSGLIISTSTLLGLIILGIYKKRRYAIIKKR